MYTLTTLNEEKFPLVVEAKKPLSSEDFYPLISEEQATFKSLLQKHGALLFRNFPISTPQDFSNFIKHLQLGNFIQYLGGDSPRNKIIEGVYTSTEAAPSLKIPLHNELSYAKNYPRYILFFCEIAPTLHGETSIADARKVYTQMPDEIKKKFIEKKLLYVSRYFYKSRFMDLINSIQKGHKSWIDVFETESKQEVDQKCREGDLNLVWNKNDWIEISRVGPATLKHPQTQENVWFNQAHLFDLSRRLLGFWRNLGANIVYFQDYMRLHEVFFADQSPIPRKDLNQVFDVLDANTINFPWQKRDVLVLDNLLSMHGRQPFTGKRRILTAMTG